MIKRTAPIHIDYRVGKYGERCTFRFEHAELAVSPRHIGKDVKGNDIL